jgi:hypothetical protein
MLYNIPFVADWKKTGHHRQSLTDRRARTKKYQLQLQGQRYSTHCKRRYPPQIRVQIWQRAMDCNDRSYEWNYQGSMRNIIRMDKHPESNTFHSCLAGNVGRCVGDFSPPKRETCRYVGAMLPTRHRPCRRHCTVSAHRTSCRCRVGTRKL